MKRLEAKFSNCADLLTQGSRKPPVRIMWGMFAALASLTFLSGCALPGASSRPADISMPASVIAGNGSGESSSPHGNVTISAQTATEEPSGDGNPEARFKGCWHKQRGRRYQAIDVSVGKPGTYAFNAVLYHGTTCNPDDIADQFGFGQLLNLGGDYTFWFTAFPDRPDMSALWYVGDEHSKCVSYETAPDC